jgi:hypothetical protein
MCGAIVSGGAVSGETPLCCVVRGGFLYRLCREQRLLKELFHLAHRGKGL